MSKKIVKRQDLQRLILNEILEMVDSDEQNEQDVQSEGLADAMERYLAKRSGRTSQKKKEKGERKQRLAKAEAESLGPIVIDQFHRKLHAMYKEVQKHNAYLQDKGVFYSPLDNLEAMVKKTVANIPGWKKSEKLGGEQGDEPQVEKPADQATTQVGKPGEQGAKPSSKKDDFERAVRDPRAELERQRARDKFQGFEE